MTNFRITVTSDTVCPWCYIGRKQLLRAQDLWRQRHPDSHDTFSVTYAPYQLVPDWGPGAASSMDKGEFYQRRFGDERTAMMQSRLTSVGREHGIAFKYGGRTGNSRDSHRVVHLARKYGGETQLKAVDGLFAAYFEHEGDITDVEVLRRVAVTAGVPEEDFQRAIVDGDEGGREVDEAVERARAGGVSGVPDFNIQGRFRLGGAREAADFVDVFEKVRAEEAA